MFGCDDVYVDERRASIRMALRYLDICESYILSNDLY